MKKLFLLLLLVLPKNSFSQCNLMADGGIQAFVKWNTALTFSWVPPENTSGLLYYRIRRASTISGTYTVIATIPFDRNSYNIVWKGGDYHYFVTSWYSIMENGVSVIRESVGSNQVRVRTR